MAQLSIWKSIWQWLDSAPIADPVDRRNAPAMQLLLLYLGIAPPMLWAYHILSAGMPRGGTWAFTEAMLVSAVQLAAVIVIRRGHFRTAVTMYLAAALLALEVAYLRVGLRVASPYQIDTILCLVVGGLMLGRKVLWIIFAALTFIALSGLASDFFRHDTMAPSLANLMTVLFSQLIVAAIIDRTVHALRTSLAESEQRSRDLQREMLARERAQAQLVHAQKLEATGRLASGIAHDFGNILGVIAGYASLRDRILGIERRDEQEAAIDKTLSGIGEAADRGTAITRKLLSFSRHDMTRAQVFDAGRAIAGLEQMLRQLFPRSVLLELPEAGAPTSVRFDPSEFELMILNIAANARDAMPGGGVFRIALAEDPAGTVAITASDSGHGMPDAVRQRIFEPFFSTKSDIGGTGLGLAVIRDMILSAGGDISVESVEGQGSAFRIALPLAGGDAAPDGADGRHGQVVPGTDV